MKREARETRNITQPENSWKKPSALSGSQYWMHNPVPKMRIALAAIAMGMLARASAALRGKVFSRKYPKKTESVNRLTRERMPLQASATSNCMEGSSITLPSRRTGTPNKGSKWLASFEARIWRGMAISLKIIAGRGMARKSTSKAKRRSLRSCHPPKQSTNPASSITSETRDKKIAAPYSPRSRTTSPRATTAIPLEVGAACFSRRVFLLAHTRYAAKMGTRKPWEKSGFTHQVLTRPASTRWYTAAKSTPIITTLHAKGASRKDQGFLGIAGIWMYWAIFSNRGTFGITNRYTFLSNRNAESGTAQSKGIPQELSGIRNELYRSSGKLFPLYWEINVTILSTGREKHFPYLVIRLSRKSSQGRI